MPLPRELDERMTMNVQSWKKEKLTAIAAEERISGSRLLLKIVDEWFERQNGSPAGASQD